MAKAKKEKPGSGKEKDTSKSKHKKGKDVDTDKNEDIKNEILDDELWQSIVVLVVVDNQRLLDYVLQQLNTLPINFTVITPEVLLSVDQKESSGIRSRGSSKTRKESPSKESKKTEKTKKDVEAKKESPGIRSRGSSKTRKGSASKESKKPAKTKKDDDTKKSGRQGKQKDEKLSDESISAATCIFLKKYILELKRADIKELENKVENEKYEAVDKGTTRCGKPKGEKENVSENVANSLVQRYVILCGFCHPDLLQECMSFNIIIRGIINIKDTCPLKLSTEVAPATEKKHKGKAKKSSNQQASEEYSGFADKLETNMKDKDFLEINRNVLFLNYLTTTEKDHESFFKPNFLKILCGLSEAWGKFIEYNRCLKIQDIPDIQEALTLDDANVYTTMISMVPLESVSVPIIIHSMLEQICWWDEHILSKIDDDNEGIELSADNSFIHKHTSTTSTIDLKTSIHSVSVNQSFTTTNAITLDKNNSSMSEISVPNITPILIYDSDKIRHKTFHLDIPEINFQQITTDMMLSSSVHKLWQNFPLPSDSKSKWYKFHLQKFKKCTENRYFDSDKIFMLYLYQSIMNVLISKPEKLSVRLGGNIPDQEENDFQLPHSEGNESITSYIQDMVCNILCRATGTTNYTSNYSSSEDNSAETSYKEVMCNRNSELTVISSKWYEMRNQETSKCRSFFEEKLNHRLMKVNKLKSFLLCQEFLNLYKHITPFDSPGIIDHMKDYEFVECLDETSMCQSLQEAYENFVNVNYYYFPLYDTIFLWFNNSEAKDITPSRKVKGVLETPLGFRDFYKYKLGGKSNFEEEPVYDGVANVSILSNTKNSGESFSTFSSSERSISNHGCQTGIDEFLPATVINLGLLRIEHNEHYDYFFSPDSTKVVVKKTKYFSDQTNIEVSAFKNNTSLHYNILPEAHNEYNDIMIKTHNEILVNAHLTWTRSDTPQVNDELASPDSKGKSDVLLSCDLKLTLPSGLMIEVVPIESSIGPFYIRQRYLVKGPTCGKIWDESHRCYLNNGTILIFNSDNSVYIFYNNGTMVKCDDFEWEKTVLEKCPAENESTPKENNVEDIKTKNTNEGVSDKSRKEGKGKNKEEKSAKNKKTSSSSKKKKNKSSNPIEEGETLNFEPDQIGEEIYTCKATKHSVLSWDGFCTEFQQGISQSHSVLYDQRTAFDHTNQELYLQRSDGMASLFTPAELSILFPDGSKITSHTNDSKELNLESETLLEAVNTTKELESNKEINIISRDDSVSMSTTKSVELSSVSYSSENYNKDNSLNIDNFVYVETSHLFEHTNYATIKFLNEDRKAEISLPGAIVVYIDENRMFTIHSGGNEKLILTESNLYFEAQVLQESPQKSITTLEFKIDTNTPTVCCQTVDSFCNVFSINRYGKTSLVRNTNDLISPIPMHPKNVGRYFVLNRDLSGYEMIRNLKVNNKSDVEISKTPLVKNNDKLFSLHIQTPIFKNKSEQFLMCYVKENNLPTRIKRKDLLKSEETPDIIWFYPEISKIDETQNDDNFRKSKEDFRKSRCNPTAMNISKYLRIKNDLDLSSWFIMALNKYMEMTEKIVNKYLHHYPNENRDLNVYTEGEIHKQQVLGCQSYYLTDNLPMGFLDSLLNDKEKLSIYSVPASTDSKLTSLLDMMKQNKT